MSDPLGTYTFLPWVRRGVVNQITAPVGAGMRAKIDVTVNATGIRKDGTTDALPVPLPVDLYGPGDVVGIDPAQISRIEPANWVTNFEPNYLASIEFYDEDFAWRYTPAQADGKRLAPWLTLVVLEEGTEFREKASVKTRPLPFIEILEPFDNVFPHADETWAWAHAHFNSAFSAAVVENDADLASTRAEGVIASAPDTACSRLLCPRRLKPRTGYHAFLMPAFESGRLAGLGHDPKQLFDVPANGLVATSAAWTPYLAAANRPEDKFFPFYFRWYFRTAEDGDFEALVRLLKPQPVDSRVGHRDMDVTQPAHNVTGINDLGGMLRLGGALRAPLKPGSPEETDFDEFDNWATPYPTLSQKQIATFVNLADSYQASGPQANADPALSAEVNDEDDPLVTPPIYGRWPAMVERLLVERDGSDVPNRDNWIHDLNLDPRWRVAAGFGTKVVQDNQEAYMDAAWDQIGDVIEVNRRIRFAQVARLAGRRLHARHLAGKAEVSPGGFVMMQAPVAARLVSEGQTVRHRLRRSPMGNALTSTAMRRVLRPSGRAARRLDLDNPAAINDVVVRTNAGEVTAAPPQGAPAAALTPDDLADAARGGAPTGNPLIGFLADLLEKRPLIAFLIALAAFLLALLLGPLAALIGLGLIAGAWALARPLLRHRRAAKRFDEESLTPETVDELAGSSSFIPLENSDLRTAGDMPAGRPGGVDNDAARSFKKAVRDQYRLIATSKGLGEPPVATPLDLEQVAVDALAGLDPRITVPRWTLAGIELPERVRNQTGVRFVELMAYPEFDIPMYEPLTKAGDDLFVPNLHLVPPDSVTLLKTNQRFIEAYMVGLNHEFARELLWREYPTDQRGSYFRQFWDVRRKMATEVDKGAARERLKDIRPLHEWAPESELGAHDNRETGPIAEEELVLVIRGELLKKYPNTIISAQKAKWRTKGDGTPDKARERELDPAVEPMFPLYEARVEPDIYFFGFDLTEEVARGDDRVDDKPGWFFRIEEVPGDARFGFDVSRDSAKINVWNDLAWPDVAPGLAPNRPMRIASVPAHALEEPTGEAIEKHEQWEHDRFVALAGLSAAELAYVALQTPVLMAVHASELLPEEA